MAPWRKNKAKASLFMGPRSGSGRSWLLVSDWTILNSIYARASPERGARTAHLTVSDFCRERLPGGPCTHWKALAAANY